MSNPNANPFENIPMPSSHEMIFEDIGSFGKCPGLSSKNYKFYHIFSPYFIFKSFTFLFFLIIWILFFVAIGLNIYSDQLPDIESLITLGALYPDHFTLTQSWTLITNIFLHASFIHILGNSTFLLLICFAIEKYYGHIIFFFLFIIMGASGSFFHLSLKNSILVGCSSSLFGFLAIVITEYVIFWNRITQRFFCICQITLTIFILFYIYPAIMPFIAVYAHFGGFISGLFFSYLINYKKVQHTKWYYFGLFTTLCGYLALLVTSIINILRIYNYI